MAIVYAARDFQYGIAFGNVAAGTPSFTATSWAAINTFGLPVEAIVDLKKNVAQRRPFRANTFRHLRATDVQNDMMGVAPSATISLPLGYAGANDTTDFFLASIFQKVAISTTYLQAYTLPSTAADQKSFSGNTAGFFLLVEKHPMGASSSSSITSLTPTKSTFSWKPDANDGRLFLSMDCVGRYFSDSTTYSGTLTQPTSWAWFDHLRLADVTINAVSIPCFGFSLAVDTNPKSIPTKGYAGLGGYNETDRALPLFAASGSIDVLLDATSIGYIKQEASSGPVQIAFQFSAGATPASAGEFVLKCNAQFNDHSFQGTEEAKYTLNFDCVESASTELVEAKYYTANNRASTYTSSIFA